MKMKCSQCSGNGWYDDHTPAHYDDPSDNDCGKHGCPIQVECENCEGTGYVKNE